MQHMKEPMETIYLYLVREEGEEAPRPFWALPLLWAGLCLVFIAALTLSSGEHPALDRQTIRVPIRVLPPTTFTTSVKVVPTGVKTFPAMHATGTLTLTNGSIVSEELPQGMLFLTTTGVAVVTEAAVWVPAGSATGYGSATVAAHVVPTDVNLVPLAVNQVVGTSLYVRNLVPFTGGRKAATITFATSEDRLRAIAQARQVLARHTRSELLLRPCQETVTGAIIVWWQCEFVTYHVPSDMHVIGVQLRETFLFIEVVFVVRPQPWHGK